MHIGMKAKPKLVSVKVSGLLDPGFGNAQLLALNGTSNSTSKYPGPLRGYPCH
jgi:hypothetical protein